MDAQLPKIGMVLVVLLVQQDKTGMPLQDHVDALQDQTGTEFNVLVVSAEDNGMLLQNSVYAQLDFGMDSPALHVLQDKPGTQPLYLAPAHQILIGMDLHAQLVLEIEFGISNLTIALVELETGMELLVSFAQLIPTGMDSPVLLALEVDYGILTA